MSRLNVGTLNASSSINLPNYTSANRPTNPEVGQIIFNTEINAIEIYTDAGWFSSSSETVSAIGGSVTNADGYKIHTFTGTGSFTVSAASPGATCEMLIVAGGGGGGGSTAGGGGAGGLIYNPKVPLSTGSYTITVGGGGSGTQRADQGAPVNTSGGNSSALGYTAFGGGAGFSGSAYAASKPAQNGGSGGGGGYYSGNLAPNGQGTRGFGVQGQGNDGGFGDPVSEWGGGGGGGAGAEGVRQGDGTSQSYPSRRQGGDGLQYDISGTPTYYAGGGGGGVNDASAHSLGGLGGGGKGGSGTPNVAEPGSVNTGGGGGGGGYYQYGPGGAAGGSGIVIIRYRQ